MLGLFRKRVTLLNTNWEVMKEVRLRSIPSYNDLVYIEEAGKYMRVIHVVHYVSGKHGIFIVLKDIEEEIKKTLQNT